jgi:hypothetical protein
MRKLLLTALLALVFVVPASASSSVPIVMRDPGCHWFRVGGKYLVRYASNGPVTVKNFDEAALVFYGPAGTRKVAVGKAIRLTAKGTYKVKMVGQLRHDNTLTLVVR